MPKKKKSTIKDIAEALGISTSLISFVLNGKAKEKRVSDGLAEKVLDMAKTMNYKVNYMAKSLRTGNIRKNNFLKFGYLIYCQRPN